MVRPFIVLAWLAAQTATVPRQTASAPPAPIVIPPKQTLTARLVLVGRADAESTRITTTLAHAGGYLRFHLVGPDQRKLELTCIDDAVDALAKNVVAPVPAECRTCDCTPRWTPSQTTQVSGLYCFDPGGVTFQQFFSTTQVDYI